MIRVESADGVHLEDRCCCRTTRVVVQNIQSRRHPTRARALDRIRSPKDERLRWDPNKNDARPDTPRSVRLAEMMYESFAKGFAGSGTDVDDEEMRVELVLRDGNALIIFCPTSLTPASREPLHVSERSLSSVLS